MYEDLYEQNKWLLYSTARKYRGYCEMDPAVSFEDLVQAGFIGLVDAARTYNNEKLPWSYHARWCMIKEIYNVLGLRNGKPIKAHTGAISLDCPALADEENSASLGDLLPDDSIPPPDEALLLEEVQISVRRAIDNLTDPRQRHIMTVYMLEGKSLSDAATMIGMTPMQARQVYFRAVSILSRNFRLRSLVDLDDRTRFYARKSVQAFNQDWTSVTEEAALWRVEQQEKLLKRPRMNDTTSH